MRYEQAHPLVTAACMQWDEGEREKFFLILWQLFLELKAEHGTSEDDNTAG